MTVTRYNYNQQVSPPAPFVHVTVRHPQADTSIVDLPAQIDTAADLTALPAEVVMRLQLVPLDQLAIQGFGGQVSLVPTYVIEIAIRGLRPLLVKALGGTEPFVLLGRDVLNEFRLELNGPQLVLDIEADEAGG